MPSASIQEAIVFAYQARVYGASGRADEPCPREIGYEHAEASREELRDGKPRPV